MDLSSRVSLGAIVKPHTEGWHLEISPTIEGNYALVQLDDYAKVVRRQMKWTVPTCLHLRAKVSETNLPGTWGFGFWNDPFSFNLGLGGMGRRLPALPNAAWFFYASAHNYLSFRDDLPFNGFLTQTFSSPKIPSILLAPGALLIPLLAFRPLARSARKLIRKLVRGDSYSLEMDVTKWHEYGLNVNLNQVEFSVDSTPVFKTNIVPRGPMGIVIWIDNQYASFNQYGEIKAGTLTVNAPAWMDIENINIG